MGVRVLKFGGAALRDADGISRVAGLVARARAEGRPIAVVVSALEGVTDRLAHGLDRILEDDGHVPLLVRELGDQHRDTLAALAPGDGASRDALDALLLRLERVLYGIATTGDASPRVSDLALSFGERLSAVTVAAALGSAGLPAEGLDAEQAGIRTKGPFGLANPDLPALAAAAGEALRPRLARGLLPVVTGYYGVDAEGHATLFGRGGSDYVAALVAWALDAEALELWKDVPGFLTADPRLVPEARLVPWLGYDEAAELSQFGARVLHPRLVEPVQQKRIPVHVRCFLSPEAPGTTISAAPPGLSPGMAALGPRPSVPGLRGVACRDGLALLRLRGPGLAAQAGVARTVFTAIPGINVLTVANSQTALTLAVADGDAARAYEALSRLDGAIQSVSVEGGHSLVCVVGAGLRAPGAAARILTAVGQAGVHVEMISLAGNDAAFDFVVRTKEAPMAVRAIHAHVENGASTPSATAGPATARGSA